jgi:hypothetical protein
MSAANGQIAASGLMGALTSLFVGATEQILPGGHLKAVVSIMAGMTASVVTFEILSRIVLWRLVRQKQIIDTMIPSIKALQVTIGDAIVDQIRMIKEGKSDEKDLEELEVLLSKSRSDLAKALLAVQKKSFELVEELGK